MSIITSHTPTARGLASWEVSTIEKAAEAIDGCWTATAFECECCGKMTAAVMPICEAVDGPTFEISRDHRKIRLTTTWLDGEDYVSEHWSLPGALRTLRATIYRAAQTEAEPTA
jgi:hypothetical protein